MQGISHQKGRRHMFNKPGPYYWLWEVVQAVYFQSVQRSRPNSYSFGRPCVSYPLQRYMKCLLQLEWSDNKPFFPRQLQVLCLVPRPWQQYYKYTNYRSAQTSNLTFEFHLLHAAYTLMQSESGLGRVKPLGNLY